MPGHLNGGWKLLNRGEQDHFISRSDLKKKKKKESSYRAAIFAGALKGFMGFDGINLKQN